MKSKPPDLRLLTYLIILAAIVLLTGTAWELWLKPYMQPPQGAEFRPESTEDYREYVIMVFLVCLAFLFAAFRQAFKIENKTNPGPVPANDPHDNTADDATFISLQTVLDSISDPILVIDRDYRVRMLNKAARNISLNGSQPSGTFMCHKLTHNSDEPCCEPEHECPLSRVIQTGKSCTVLHQHLDSQGNPVPFEILASPVFDGKGDLVGIVELARDISGRLAREKKQEQTNARLLTLQREQSIATLAGGLAHEFNNILTSILGNAELLHIRLDENDKNRELAESIIHGSEHLADLTRQLLAYAKGGKYLNQAILLNAQIKDSLRLIHADRFSDIAVDLDLTADLWPVLGDPAQLSQLLMNVIINGFEAMENRQGTMTIRTTNLVKTDQWECNAKDIHPPGYYVLVSVANTGPTISEELKDKIFEPFFSTKFAGRGMGLAAAKGIVQNHNGCISVTSGPERTTFDILLPREIPDHEYMKESKKTAADILDLNVLVIDDDPHVLSIVRSLLAHHGCKVISTDKGFEATGIIEKNRDKLDLVILDIKMPGMSGDEVYKRLKEINPGLKVLISSGHDEYTALKNIELFPQDRFIKKPFRMSDLMLKVKELIVSDSG